MAPAQPTAERCKGRLPGSSEHGLTPPGSGGAPTPTLTRSDRTPRPGGVGGLGPAGPVRRGSGAETGSAPDTRFVCGRRGLRRGPSDLAFALVTPRCMRWGEASALGVGPLRRKHPPDRHVRRPEGYPCGRPTQASRPRFFVSIMSRRTSLSVGPTLFGQSPDAAGGCSVQRPRCSGPGAPRSVAHQRFTRQTAPVDTPGSSLAATQRRGASGCGCSWRSIARYSCPRLRIRTRRLDDPGFSASSAKRASQSLGDRAPVPAGSAPTSSSRACGPRTR